MDGFFNNQLSITDPEISNAIEKEKMRQKEQVELIASENIVSQAVLDAQGSILTNKYAEGYSGRRYYGGCEFIDDLETIGINRVTELFNCKYANIQPHSGAQANQAVFMSLIKPGDKIIALFEDKISSRNDITVDKYSKNIEYGADNTNDLHEKSLV